MIAGAWRWELGSEELLRSLRLSGRVKVVRGVFESKSVQVKIGVVLEVVDCWKDD